ncbi:twin-arginine translocase TatA/TatE family subunit [Avrilella dinanensis]|uniref:Sec-independent protein translocase protein TatA n=1 Tax=Avrilella dinanensis TaxID=2008672 RepID=A0A2M9R4I5_9FLAO|nr:twin-arginine translocase TatA/TatE family subunit [Avrilella dinanensis]PJR03655.1 twin-arginine translocase TatA/TatE family subunit [Avrilella dinanensis]
MNSFIILGMPSWTNILIILVVVLLLFGGKKIPELMKGLGSGIKEFKDATKEENTKNNSQNNNPE